MESVLLEVENISRQFSLPDKSRLIVLQDLSLKVEVGTVVAITGASGSGKSTLLHLVGSLDRPDSGRILFNGADLLQLSDNEISEYRNREIGFVYQFHYLMPELSVLENVMFPFLMREFKRPAAEEKGEALLRGVGLSDKRDVMPYQLSGGERQRAAIARSLINGPRLLLADEPTGNLDWQTGEKVFDLFRELIKKNNLTALIVTHNEPLARLADRRYHLRGGRLEENDGSAS